MNLYDKSKKPYLSPSSYTSYEMCAHGFRLVKIDKIKTPSDSRRLVGCVVHPSTQMDLGCKAITGVLMRTDDLKDAARTLFDKEENKLQEETGFEIQYDKDEKRGDAIDISVKLTDLYHRTMAPLIWPTGIEVTYRLDTGDFPYDLLCRIDVTEEATCRDTKTAKRKPSATVLEGNMQGIFNSLAFEKKHGIRPKFINDTLIKNKVPTAYTYEIEYTNSDYDKAFLRLEAMVDAMAKGVYLPASASSWKCSPTYCDLWNYCEYGAKQKVQI